MNNQFRVIVSGIGGAALALVAGFACAQEAQDATPLIAGGLEIEHVMPEDTPALSAWDGDVFIGSGRAQLRVRSQGEFDEGEAVAANLALLPAVAIHEDWRLLLGARRELIDDPVWRFAVGAIGTGPLEIDGDFLLLFRDGDDVELEWEFARVFALSPAWSLKPELAGANLISSADEAETGSGEIGFSLQASRHLAGGFSPYVKASYTRLVGTEADLAAADGAPRGEAAFAFGLTLEF